MLDLGKALQNYKQPISDKIIAGELSHILQLLYPSFDDAKEYFCLQNDITERNLWNWYHAVNMPNTASFIYLCSLHHEVTHLFLKLSNQEAVWEAYIETTKNSKKKNKNHPLAEIQAFYTDIFVGINLEHNIELNQRQLWVVKQLQSDFIVTISHITRYWKISKRTAERDLSVLVKSNIIRYEGAKRLGRYYLCNKEGGG